MKKQLSISILAVPFVALLAGCASDFVGERAVNATVVRPLRPTSGADTDLSHYAIATVVPFVYTGKKSVHSEITQDFASAIAARLKADFGPLFKEVRFEDQARGGKEGELIITGNIREYEPGSASQRAMLIGNGAAVFKADLILKDGPTGRELLSAPIDKLWAWGGALGASRNIEDMLAESAAAAARTIAVGKGWKKTSI